MQALSEEDRRLWMEAMDGREPVSSSFGRKAEEMVASSGEPPGQIAPCGAAATQRLPAGAGAPASCQENPFNPLVKYLR